MYLYNDFPEATDVLMQFRQKELKRDYKLLQQSIILVFFNKDPQTVKSK